MPHTKESTVYKFEELTESAKEKAREWFRTNDDFDAEFTYEYAAACGDILGIDLRTRAVKLRGGGTHYDPCIYYSGFYNQGDGACFEGSYTYAKGAAKEIRAYAPEDKELHCIADALQALQQQNAYALEATTFKRGRYNHSGCMVVDVSAQNDLEFSDDAEEKLTQLLRDFADWIYQKLEKEYEWRNADEQVDESIICNDYEFDEDGNFS